MRRRPLSVLSAFFGAATICVACAASDVSSSPPNAQVAVPESQQLALSDGTVSFEELELAFQRVVSCLEEGGIVMKASHIELRANNVVFSELGYESGIDAQRSARLEDECKKQHFNAMFNIYSRANAPSRAEQATLAKRLLECLRKEGVGVNDLDGVALQQAQVEHPTEFGICSSRVRST